MKTYMGYAILIAIGLVVGCSNSGNKFGSDNTSGGAGGGGGANGTAGNAGATTEVKDWGDAGTSTLFGTLTAYCDAASTDICCQVIPWNTGTNNTINSGDLVVGSDGKVYAYTTTNSSCNNPMTYMMADCDPTTASSSGSWCSQCWTLQADVSCPNVIASSGTGGTSSTTTTTTTTGTGGTTGTTT